MDRNPASKRPISAHRLPMSLPLPPAGRHTAPAAAFLVQLMETPRSGKVASTPLSRGNLASQSYRSAEASDARRLPPGYRKSILA